MLNFTPYTYLIGWPNLNTWYYGVRYAQGCNPTDLWNPYKTSSKYVKKFIEENGDPTFFQIRRTFNSIKAARFWETKVLRRIKAVKREDFLNKTDNVSICPEVTRAFMLGKEPWNKDKKLPPQSIDSNNKRSKTLKEHYKDKPGNRSGLDPWNKGLKGFTSPLKGLSQKTTTCPHCNKTGGYTNMGRWHFDNCKENPHLIPKEIDKLIWITNGDLSKMIKTSLLSEYLLNGYRKGRI